MRPRSISQNGESPFSFSRRKKVAVFRRSNSREARLFQLLLPEFPAHPEPGKAQEHGRWFFLLSEASTWRRIYSEDADLLFFPPRALAETKDDDKLWPRTPRPSAILLFFGGSLFFDFFPVSFYYSLFIRLETEKLAPTVAKLKL